MVLRSGSENTPRQQGFVRELERFDPRYRVAPVPTEQAVQDRERAVLVFGDAVIRALAAEDSPVLIACPAIENVVAEPAGQNIVLRTPVEPVVSGAAPQDVIPSGAFQRVIVVAAIELVSGMAVPFQTRPVTWAGLE